MRFLVRAPLFLIIFSFGYFNAHAAEGRGVEYEELDKNTTMQAVLATLQEIGFNIESVDTTQWTVKSVRYVEKYGKQLAMNLSLEQTAKGVLVQAEVLVNKEPLPQYHIAYHNFFVGLEQFVSQLRHSQIVSRLRSSQN
jgi:hypothetical protein